MADNHEHSVSPSAHEILIAIGSDEQVSDCAFETVNAMTSNDEIDDAKDGENLTGETDPVCRICLSNSESASRAMSASNGLVQLGCRCKGEIGLVHVHCAHTWFQKKGNRNCEICGDTAKNIVRLVHGIVIGDGHQTADAADATETTLGSDLGGLLLNMIFGCLFMLPV